MSKSREIRWRIDAYTRETMPLGRLAEYLRELAGMLGEEPHVHLIAVDSSSTVPVLNIDPEAADRVGARASQIRLGTASQEAMQRYRNINRMLREDHGTAALLDDGAEIIPFPGQDEPKAGISGIQQQGSLDGQLMKMGGPKEWVPLQLQLPDKATITGCYARRGLATEMGHYFFKPIRVYGRGKWNRSIAGDWTLDQFFVDSFEPLDAEPLPSVVASLRAVRADWPDDPIAALHSLRHETGEDD